MTGHIRSRGENSWELKFDLGRDPASARAAITPSKAPSARHSASSPS